MPDMSAFHLRDNIEFYDHQKSGIKWMSYRRHLIQGDDMGLGKTLQTLVTFCMDVKDGRARNNAAIVISPNSAIGNWYEEIVKYTTVTPVILGELPDRKTRLNEKDRKLQLAEFKVQQGPKILICSYETSVKHATILGAMKFHMSIFDEVHKTQNPESKRTQAAVEVAMTAVRTIVLSGTLMPNDVRNLWAPLYMTRAETRGPKAFLNRYAVMEDRKVVIKAGVGRPGDENYKPPVTKTERRVVGVKREAELRAKLYGDPKLQELVKVDPAYRQRVIDDPDFRVQVYGIMLRRLKDNVLDLPPVNKIQVFVDLTPEQRKLYLQVMEDMLIETPEGQEDIEVDGSFAKFGRLKQICGSTFPFTGEDHSAKMDKAIDIVYELTHGDGIKDRKIVAFTQYRAINDLFTARVRDGLGIEARQLHGDIPARDRTGVIREWGDSSGHGVIVAGLQVTAEALNMTQSRDVIFLDKLFVPLLNQQAIDRVNRIGQQLVHPINVYEIICRFTVEERVEDICKSKMELFDRVFDEKQAFRLMSHDLMRDAENLRAMAA